MADVRTEVLNVLLKTLLDQKLITETVYDGAKKRIASAKELPDFFHSPVHCQKEGNDDGSSQN